MIILHPDDKPKIVFHFTTDGGWQVYSPDSVEVIIVNDNVPADRLYRVEPQDLPEDLYTTDEHIGSKGDGSPADIRLSNWLNGGPKIVGGTDT